ncbi:MAG: hypothetical protein U0Y68_23685 [Blastocatellia bacterium]
MLAALGAPTQPGHVAPDFIEIAPGQALERTREVFWPRMDNHSHCCRVRHAGDGFGWREPD